MRPRRLVGRTRSSRDCANAPAMRRTRSDTRGGVLFPNRLHGARVSVKKLRYAMEIATATGRIDFEHDLRQVRKAQELLGGMHDHDVLAASLRTARLGAQRLLPLIELERRRLHTRYLRRRAALLKISGRAAVCERRDHRSLAIRRSMLAASVPLAMLAVPLVRRARRLDVVNPPAAPRSPSAFGIQRDQLRAG